MSEQSRDMRSRPWHQVVTGTKAVLEEVNRSAGTRWQLDARFCGAMGDAWRVRADNSVAVLKWHEPASGSPHNPDAPRVVEFLRKAGYPPPAWLASGTTEDGVFWSVQELVDGEPLKELNNWSAELFIVLIDLQRRLQLPTRYSWDQYSRDLVFGRHPLHQPLAHAGPNVRELLAAALETAAPHTTAGLADDEMVHSDLNVSNLLVRQGQLVGVIDIDAAGRGSAAYDLMSPVINGVYWGSDPIAIERLVSYGLDVYGSGPLAVATAGVLIEVTNWYLGCSPAHIEQRAERLLRWLSDVAVRLA